MTLGGVTHALGGLARAAAAGLAECAGRWFGPVALALVLVWTSTGAARASTGRTDGFAVERASSQMTIGRVKLRYEPALEDDAVELARQIPAWWSAIERPLARDVDDAVTIHLVDHAGRVAEATGMPRWVAGVARPEAGEIVIARHGPDGARTDLEQLLKHEMAHVILHRASGGAELPRWFHEGVAESVTGGISLSRSQTLAQAVFGPGVPDLDRLEAQFRGRDGPDAALAYAAARDLVEFLRAHEARTTDAHGAALRQAMFELRAGRDFDDAMGRAFGAPLPELVKTWRDGLPTRFVWFALIAGGGLPMALALPLVLAAWVRRRRIIGAAWARLAAEDELDRAGVATLGVV